MKLESFLGERVSAADAAVLYEECGGNPLPRAARPVARARRAASAPESSPTSLEATGGRCFLNEEVASLSDGGRLVGRSGGGRPTNPSFAAAAAATSEAAAMAAVDELLQMISSTRPTCLDVSASDTRSSGALSTRPLPAAGDSAPTSVVRKRSQCGERQRRRAPITSSVRRARETPQRGRLV